MSGLEAEQELRRIVMDCMENGAWMDRGLIAQEIVETLVLERQDILAALHEQPRRWWLMERDTKAPKSPPVWLGGDEFDNRTLVLWWPGSRWLVVSLSLRLKRELMR